MRGWMRRHGPEWLWPLLVVAGWTVLYNALAGWLEDPWLRQAVAIVGTGLASVLAAWLAARRWRPPEPHAALATAVTQAAETIVVTDRTGKSNTSIPPSQP